MNLARSVVQGESHTFIFPLATPAAIGSATWLLRDATGTALQAESPAIVRGDGYAISVTLPGTLHGALGARFLVVGWTSDGGQERLTHPYRVVRWFPHTVTPQDVRNELGLNSEYELLDADVDLVAAAEMVEVSVPNLIAILANADSTTLYANRAVALRAALNLGNSLQLRAAASMSSDTVKFSRFAKVDFGLILKRMLEEYGDILQTLRSAETTVPTIFSLSTPASDPITGA